MIGRLAQRGLYLLLAALLVGLIAPARAQEGGFRATFDDANALDTWEHSEGVAVVDGALRIEPNNYALLLGYGWEDFSLSVRALRSGDGFLVVSYRATDQGAYTLGFGDEYMALGREEGGASTELTRAPVAAPADTWVQLGITVTGGSHTITLDGQTVLTANDPQPLAA